MPARTAFTEVGNSGSQTKSNSTYIKQETVRYTNIQPREISYVNNENVDRTGNINHTPTTTASAAYVGMTNHEKDMSESIQSPT